MSRHSLKGSSCVFNFRCPTDLAVFSTRKFSDLIGHFNFEVGVCFCLKTSITDYMIRTMLVSYSLLSL